MYTHGGIVARGIKIYPLLKKSLKSPVRALFKALKHIISVYSVYRRKQTMTAIK